MKKKNVALDAGMTNASASNSMVDLSQPVNIAVEQTEVPVTEVVEFKTKYIDAEIQKKLDTYDLVESQNAMLLKEKAELEAKIAEYIEENAALKSPSTSNADELTTLKEKVTHLEQASAQYLRRISDLTFENATLTAQLKELSTHKQQSVNTISPTPVKDTWLETAPYDPYQQNGYSDWN